MFLLFFMILLDTPSAISNFLKNLPGLPGVYQMYNSKNILIYIGKAQNLKKRVSSYFQKQQKSIKTQALVSHISYIEIVITKSSMEALLLEQNLIKEYKPRYNILFRDDKSYPYIFLSHHPKYPRIEFHRGPKKEKGEYFGPYPNSYAVRQSIQFIQKNFLIRNCKDFFFNHRSRPCVQYQIRRCTAPCVDYISPEAYFSQLHLARLFLRGKSHELIELLISQMQSASENMEFEKAARIRDQIAQLKSLQEQQSVLGEERDVDVIAIAKHFDLVVIQILYFRTGRLIGNRNFYPKIQFDSDKQEILSEFLPQYYLGEEHIQDIPQDVYLNEPIIDIEWVFEALSTRVGRKIQAYCPTRGEKKRWLDMAIKNAEAELERKSKNSDQTRKRFELLTQILNLSRPLLKIECFDISHHSGEATVASCVVFQPQGPAKNFYRRFNIKNITEGDDYAAMRQALKRRYKHILEDPSNCPNLVVIDGGIGQLNSAREIWQELDLNIPLLAIAKGATRKAGLETLYFNSPENIIQLPEHSPAFHLLQQIRDEAHRFAITAQRKQRDSRRLTSVLQSIPGIGAKRRQTLLEYFGGLELLKQASIEQIASVPGIQNFLAKRIYEFFHV